MSLDVNISETDEFNCNELHDCIKSVAKIKEISEFTYHVDILSGKGANYIANVFRVCIEETRTDRTLSVIVKTLVNTARQKIFRELHKREVLAYMQVIDKYVNLQNDISTHKRILLPKFIFLSEEENNEVIVLEDILLNGFAIENDVAKFGNLDYTHVCQIMKELAKFHGLSFVLEKEAKENFKDIQSDFNDVIFNEQFLNKSKLRNYFEDSYQTSVNLINNNEVKKKLGQRKDKILDLLRKYTEPRKYNVFCHGDCWINNILFKEEDGEKKICFVDFQAMRYASPVTDILYFLYICTDSEFRSKYFTDLKTDYYESLKSFLYLFQLDANNVYPKTEFEKDITEMLPFGLLVALLELKLVTTTPEDVIIENMNNPGFEDIENASGGEELYRLRVNDVINESIDNGVLNLLYSDLIKYVIIFKGFVLPRPTV